MRRATRHGREGEATISPARQRRWSLAAVLCVLALVSACSSPAPSRKAALHRPSAGGMVSPAAAPAVASATPSPSPRPAQPRPLPAYCHAGGTALWDALASCGWPGPTNTGPDLSQCPGGRLTPNAGSLSRTIVITAANSVISCEDITGMVDIEARNVTIKNSSITSNSGKTGEDANGTAHITVGVGGAIGILT